MIGSLKTELSSSVFFGIFENNSHRVHEYIECLVCSRPITKLIESSYTITKLIDIVYWIWILINIASSSLESGILTARYCRIYSIPYALYLSYSCTSSLVSSTFPCYVVFFCSFLDFLFRIRSGFKYNRHINTHIKKICIEFLFFDIRKFISMTRERFIESK